MPFEVRPLPGQQRHLVIQPPTPQTGSFQVRIRGALRLGADDRGRTPNIVPLDVAHVDRFFVLPSQLDQQRIDWETSGLRLVSLKDAIPDQDVDSQSVVTYMVHARPRAVIANVQRVAGERQIGLADVNISCRDDGTCYGVVAFHVEPAGQGNCTLELPSGCQLIQVTVEGVATSLIPLSPAAVAPAAQLRATAPASDGRLSVTTARAPVTLGAGAANPLDHRLRRGADLVDGSWPQRTGSTGRRFIGTPRDLLGTGVDPLAQHGRIGGIGGGDGFG